MDNKIEIYEKRLFELIDSLKEEVREILNVVAYLSLTEKYNSNSNTFVWITE